MSNPQKSNPVFKAIRKAIPFQLPLNFLCGIPSNPHRVPFLDNHPAGLQRLHTADSIPEAEMLRQVLIEAGFHVEYVPSTSASIFGIFGNTAIYVPEEEFESSSAFLQEYLNPSPEENQSGEE